jgi:hypothetical protein
VDGRGALADAAFEGRHGDDHGAMILEPLCMQVFDYLVFGMYRLSEPSSM